MQARWLSVSLAGILLAASLGAGFAPMRLNHRALHTTIAAVFLLLTPLALRAHFLRLWRVDPLNTTAWIHVVIFSFLLFLIVRMLHRWGPEKRLVVTYRGQKVDLTEFAQRHPGGSVIWHANNKRIEDVWESHGVAWHLTNPKVSQVLSHAEQHETKT
jgi:hypothetical protein